MDKKPNKVIPIGRDKVIEVRKVKYSEAQIEAVVRTMAHMGAIRDDMEILEGTEFYSKKIDDLFDIYFKSKLPKVFEQNDNSYIFDLVVSMTKQFSAMCQIGYELSLQPQQIIDRYNREMTDLLISCGVSVKKV